MFNKVRGEDEISLAPGGARDIFPFYTAPSPLFLCKPGLFSQVQSGKEVQLTAHIHEVPKLGTCGARSPLPTQLHMVVLSCEQTHTQYILLSSYTYKIIQD